MSRGISVREISPEVLARCGPDSPLHAIPKRRPQRDLEHQAQVAVFEWAAENATRYPELRWLFAVPNWIGVRTAKQGARLKAEGRKSGVPDLIFPVRRSIYPGMAIELKVKGNRPSPQQQDWIKHLMQQGWCVVVAFSAEETIRKIKEYLR